MRFLVLGDVFGKSGIEVIVKQLPNIIKNKKIDFVVINGENAADNGVGITNKNVEDLFNSGADVITSGNHVWDQSEIMKIIDKDKRILRPMNLVSDHGRGYGIFKIKKHEKKVAVINLMGNVFMKKSQNVFDSAKKVSEEIKLKKNTDFIIVDMHGEITSEKTAMGFFFDGKATMVVGTHTHVPTSDHRIMDGGTAFQTDLGMCGDYNSVIGMNKENSLKRFLNDPTAKKHFPSNGEATICGAMVEANEKTGLAKSIEPFIFGGKLNQRN
tara:strand:- start:53 stop:862 length:810 start_codon:yes stop_codon:yes gene_type:complete